MSQLLSSSAAPSPIRTRLRTNRGTSAARRDRCRRLLLEPLEDRVPLAVLILIAGQFTTAGIRADAGSTAGGDGDLQEIYANPSLPKFGFPFFPPPQIAAAGGASAMGTLSADIDIDSGTGGLLKLTAESSGNTSAACSGDPTCGLNAGVSGTIILKLQVTDNPVTMTAIGNLDGSHSGVGGGNASFAIHMNGGPSATSLKQRCMRRRVPPVSGCCPSSGDDAARRI